MSHASACVPQTVIPDEVENDDISIAGGSTAHLVNRNQEVSELNGE